MNAARLLGAVQLLVFLASLVSDRLLTSAAGSGCMAEKLVSIANNLTRVRISNLLALINSAAIVALAALFYAILEEQNKVIALVALGWFLAEALTLAVSKIGAYALVPLSRQFVAAGEPESSTFQALGGFLYDGVDRRGYDIHMLFFCLGGILWYYLLYASRIIPRALSMWGLVAICLLTIPSLIRLCDREFENPLLMALTGLPYLPFEPVLGLWLLVSG